MVWSPESNMKFEFKIFPQKNALVRPWCVQVVFLHSFLFVLKMASFWMRKRNHVRRGSYRSSSWLLHSLTLVSVSIFLFTCRYWTVFSCPVRLHQACLHLFQSSCLLHSILMRTVVRSVVSLFLLCCSILLLMQNSWIFTQVNLKLML